MDSKTVDWSSDETIRLITCVKLHPVLYNNLQYSSNRVVTEKLWELIADKIPGKTAQNCKQKWRYLKNFFNEKFNSDKRVTWPYYDSLMFLTPYIQTNGAMLNRSVRIIPQPSTSSLAVRNNTDTRGKVKQEYNKKRGREENSPKNNNDQKSEPKTKKSSIGLLFERIEKDILNLPPHEQYDFEIQVMTLFRDKLKMNYS